MKQHGVQWINGLVSGNLSSQFDWGFLKKFLSFNQFWDVFAIELSWGGEVQAIQRNEEDARAIPSPIFINLSMDSFKGKLQERPISI